MTRKRQASLTLDKQLLEMVDARGGNRSAIINRDLYDYYLMLRDFAPLTQEDPMPYAPDPDDRPSEPDENGY